MHIATDSGVGFPATARHQAMRLIADTRDAVHRHGVAASPLHCLFAVPDGDGRGWSWWLVGATGEVVPATPTLLDAARGNRKSSIFGWWVSRFSVDGPCGARGAARVIIAEFRIDAPIRGYRTGGKQDLTGCIRLVAGETPAIVLWPLAGIDAPAGWPA